MDWFKSWHTEILRGSLVAEDDSTQLIWLKLTAMVSNTKARNGRLEFGQGKPMSHNFLATSINTTVEKLEKALQIFQMDIEYDGISRITIENDGTIVLNKWNYEQHNNVAKPKRKPMEPNQKRAMHRTLNNQYPNDAIEDLKQGFGHIVIDKNGELK